MRIILAVAAAGCVLLGALTTFEAPVALLFGWISFLARTLPRMTVNGPSLAAGLIALGLFAAGVHAAGRCWHSAGGAPWEARWSLSAVAGVCLLFGAGVALVGITHQLVWLLTADRPFVREADELPWVGYAGDYVGRARSQSNLKFLALAAHNHNDTHGALPPGGTFAPDGAMQHGWAVHLLPYLNYMTRGLDLQRPWNDPHNAGYFKNVLHEFIHPGFRFPELTDGEGYGLNHYAANSHVLGGNRAMKPSEITDGPSNTLLFGEVNAAFLPWGHPANWRDPARGINRGPHGFGGPPGSGGASFVMADGSVRFLSERTSPAVLRALATPRGGEEPSGDR